MIQRHLTWASKHDWYVRTTGTAVIVREVQVSGDEVITRYRRFSSFTLLYRWAGY